MKINLNDNIKALDNISKYVTNFLKDPSGITNTKPMETYIQDTLSKIAENKTLFRVKVVKNSDQNQPFIMGTYPDVDALISNKDDLIEALNNSDLKEFCTIWNNIKLWHIEIDSRILTRGDTLCVDNGYQFTAIMCHEIGHISYAHPQAIINSYKMKKAMFSIFEKSFLKKSAIIKYLFVVMFVTLYGFRIILSKPFKDIEEIRADLYVPDKYKTHLIQYDDLHILKSTNTHNIHMTKKQYEDEQSQAVEFTRSCIDLFKTRRNVLKYHLDTQYRLSMSPYYKRLCELISNKLFASNEKDNLSKLKESNKIYKMYSNEYDSILLETNTLLERSFVTDREIDLLKVQAERMKTFDEKSFVINTIYDYIDILEFRRRKENKNEAIPKQDIYAEKINKLLLIKKKVMDTEVSDSTQHYGVFVQYPDGYKG